MRTVHRFTLAAGLLALALTIGCDDSLADKRDGKNYKTVKIGEQVWMAENMNLEVDGSKCYDDKAENCAKYGRLYNWKTAMEVCPKGWHLPTGMEWDKLFRYADGSISSGDTKSPYYSETAGKYLKAASGWNDSGNGDDKFGFAALPGGCSGCYTSAAGKYGHWWSASDGSGYNGAYRPDMYYNKESASYDYYNKSDYFSVRCVKD